METISHHGRETTYERFDRGGDGVGLCCIHGSGGTRGVWKSQQRLADRWPVVALDLSGHGESEDVDASPGYPTLSAYAADVVAVADATDAGVLVGNSLGGAVAMHVALQRDFEPDALVLTGTGARLGVLADLLYWLENDFERAIKFLHEPDRLFHDPDPKLRSRSADLLRSTGRAVTRRDFLTCHEFDVREQLPAIDVPTLAVCGKHDKLTPPWFHEYLAERIDGAAFYEIEEAAHLAMLERPAAFNRAVESFLRAHVE